MLSFRLNVVRQENYFETGLTLFSWLFNRFPIQTVPSMNADVADNGTGKQEQKCEEEIM